MSAVETVALQKQKSRPLVKFNIEINAMTEEPIPDAVRSNSENLHKLSAQSSFHPHTLIDNYLRLESDTEKISDLPTPPKMTSELGDFSPTKAPPIPQKNYLSPTKAGFGWGAPRDKSFMQSDLSPMSSHVSSFYFDRIDELLPEKKMIADKLYRKDFPTFAELVEYAIETPQKSQESPQRQRVHQFRGHFDKN